jgi:hypothetical protein
MAMIVSLEQKLQSHLGSSTDAFCRSALHCLAIRSGMRPEIEDWTVSPFDVDFDQKIGEGGL